MEGERIESLDIAKGMAIILMVAGHACIEGGRFTLWLHDFIYTFHMPFFMIVSGYLYNSNNAKTQGKYIGRKFNSLYLKFVLYNLVFILLNNVLFYIGVINSDYTFYGQSYSEYSLTRYWAKVLETLFTFGDPENTTLALWYLKDLFLVAVLFNLLMRIGWLKNNEAVIVGASLVLAVFTPTGTIPVVYINLKRLFCEIFLYGLGYMIKEKDIRIRYWGGYLVMLIMMVVSSLMNHIELRAPFGSINTFRFLIVGVAGYFCFVRAMQFLQMYSNDIVRKGLLLVNRYAIPIIALHIIVFKLFSYVVYGHISSYNVVPPSSSNIIWLVYMILGIMVPVIIMESIHVMPFPFKGKIKTD